MKHMLSAFYAKPLSVYLGAALIAVSAFAGRRSDVPARGAPGADN